MSSYRPKTLAFLYAAGILSCFASCSSSHVTSGKAIYYPAAQLQHVSGDNNQDPNGWHSVQDDNYYVDVTNLLNGKRARTQILMKRTAENGTVIISVNKKAAEALGMVYTGLAPVEIKYKRTL